jgi:hypothetical protein
LIWVILATSQEKEPKSKEEGLEEEREEEEKTMVDEKIPKVSNSHFFLEVLKKDSHPSPALIT